VPARPRLGRTEKILRTVTITCGALSRRSSRTARGAVRFCHGCASCAM